MSALLIARLYVVQIRDGHGLAANASEEQEATFALNPKRGDIIDRFGAVFATTLPSYEVYVQPRLLRRLHAGALQRSSDSLVSTIRA